MKDIYRLISWNIRRIIVWLLGLWGLLALAQTFLLIAASRSSDPFHSSIYTMLPIFVFLLIFLCAIAFTGLPMVIANCGRSRSIYTMMGLPIRREYLLISNILSGIIAGLGTFAVQICITFALYIPKGLLRQASLQKMLENGLLASTDAWSTTGVAFIKNGLFLDITSDTTLGFIFSSSVVFWLCEILILIAASLLFHCILMHRGAKLAINIFICVVGALLCAIAFVFSLSEDTMPCLIICAVIVLICTLSFWWATSSVRKSRNL